MVRLFIIPVILLLLSTARTVSGDTLSELPAHWAGRLLPVPEVNLDVHEAVVKASLVEARNNVRAALQTTDATADLATAYGELGGIYQVHMLRQPAEYCFENAMRLAPQEFRWAYYSAWLASETGRAGLAVTRFEHARKLDPDYPPVTLRLADLWLDMNELDQAKAAYRTLVDTRGLEAAALYGLGQVALLQRDYDNAIEHFTLALENDPDATRIHYPLAQALRAAQRVTEAREHLAQRGDVLPAVEDPLVTQLEAMKTGASVHFLRAMKAIRARDYAAAVSAFTRGLAIEPDNANARLSYARALYLSGDKDAAREELEEVLAIQPANTLSLFLLGVLQDEAGEAETAARLYHQVLGHEPAHDGAHFYLGNHYYRQGDYAAAGRHYEKASEIDPRNLPPRMLYLAILDKTETPDKLKKRQLEKALQEHPEQPVIMLRLARLLAVSRDPQVRDPDTALALAQQLVERQAIPPHREVLALAYAATGDYEQAITLQEALVSFTAWSMPREAQRLKQALTAYEAGQLPSRDAIPAQVLPPPRVDSIGPFQYYGAARPY